MGAACRPGRRSIRCPAMRLTPWEEERLLIFSAAELARRHRAAGIPLNHPEAVALICDAMLEVARAGGGYAEVEAAGRSAVTEAELMDGVRGLLDEVRLEVLLGDGTRLVVLLDPLGPVDPLGAAVTAGPPAAGRRTIAGDPRRDPPRRGRDRARGRARAPTPDGREPVAPGRSRVLALPVRAGQPAARLRARVRPGLPSRHPGRGDRPAGLPARSASSISSGSVVDTAGPRMTEPNRRPRSGEPALADGLSGALWPDPRRPDPGRRHGPLAARRARCPQPRRRAAVGLCQERPQPDGPGRPGGRSVGARRGPRRRGRGRSDRRRGQGRHRDQGRPDRRRSGEPATRTSATGSSCRSGRTPTRSWATG